MAEPSSALEQFRKQWQDEVSSRAKRPAKAPQPQQIARRASENRPERPINRPPTRHPVADIKQDDSDHQSDADQGGGNSSTTVQQNMEVLTQRNIDDDDFAPSARREPQSALEHFEQAVEEESKGKLGDSLANYRKAYRLDAKVDQSYKNKHFSAAWKSKPSDTNPSNAAVTVPSTAHHSLDGPKEILTFAQVIDSFAHNQIQGTEPVIEYDRPPPCGIKKLPTEVLLDLLQHVAVRDPAIYSRLALVCTKLAYHVITDNSIWKRVALGSEFGLASQKYNFQTDLQGREVVFRALEDESEEDGPSSPDKVTELSFPPDTVWRDVFHNHPRIRFTGIYISTVNYTRPGGVSATASNWSTTPVHIVTYFRYLRFFRDGTCISLLTTNEPTEVVHHLTAENLNYVRSGRSAGHPLNFTSSAPALLRESTPSSGGAGLSTHAPPPSARDVMKHALRGRWRLCHPSLDGPPSEPDTSALGPQITQSTTPKPSISPGDLHIETEGAGPRYMYTMHLSLKNAGSARSKNTTKNNKLVWKGFWSFNMLSSDWAEFHLKNDKPFFFSRVRAYGLGY